MERQLKNEINSERYASDKLSPTINRDNSIIACKSNFEKRCFTCLKKINNEIYLQFSTLIICKDCCEHAYTLIEL